ncbi:MAG TPA: PEP-CTERM sorting domain-containing protein [Myxococcota bacterium]|nr:PEP-CTERM sorting domain-containing protein [Myxococcota bacterium]
MLALSKCMPKLAVSATLAAVLSIAIASMASAVTVTYDWVNDVASSSNGSGSITFDSASITDPANFTGIPFTAVTAFNYTFVNGSNTRTISLTDITFEQLPFGFSATSGLLSPNTQFNGSDFPTNSFSLQWVGYPALSKNSLAAPFTDVDQGYWQIRAIPEPGTFMLVGFGLLTLVGFARRA